MVALYEKQHRHFGKNLAEEMPFQPIIIIVTGCIQSVKQNCSIEGKTGLRERQFA